MTPAAGRTIVDRNVPVKIRDGVTLRADVYRPDDDDRHPVLLNRTPYDKSLANLAYVPISPLRAVPRGYAIVIQDVRGRFASEGRFDPLRQEIDDGYDTVEWCAGQSWSNGKIGMYGQSYFGATQLLAAIARPPHLRALAPGVTASNFHEGWVYQGGAFELGFMMSWALNTLAPPDLLRENRLTEVRKVLKAVDRMNERSFWHLPLRDFPDLRNGAPYFYEWLDHPDEDEYWDRINIEKNCHRIEVPCLHIGGWYDTFLDGTLKNYMGIRQKGATPQARMQKLMVGPWSHLTRAFPWMGGLHGEIDFGTGVAWAVMDMEGLVLRWFDYWLKDEENDVEKEPSVKIFVMGENRWRDEEEWPLARAVQTKYYFHSGGSANSSDGDGILSTDLPRNERLDRFTYDPLNPVLTVGGATCCDATHIPGGAYDQRLVESRHDVLVYSTPPLGRGVEVTGPILIRLYASTSAVDTDFTGKLVDVHPCGFAQNLTDGIIRGRYRESRRRAKLLTPGRVYEFLIDLWATSNLFKKGHRIRVEVSSSNFPRFDRNLNTGRRVAEERDPQVAVQHVYHGRAHPSHILLPVVPR